MGTMLRRGALVLAVVSIALIGTSAATAADGDGNGNGGWLPSFTICHKPNHNGGTTMTVNIFALFGHLGHGDSFGACQAPPVDEDDGGSQGDEPEETCEQQQTCEQPPEETCEQQQTCEQPPEETCEQQETCEQPPEETCEQQETCEQPVDPTPTAQVIPSGPPPAPPAESRSLFCSTKGSAALDLPDSEGALLVGQGLATPAIFYAGVGVSCELLPGFTYAGYWVDHVGDQVPGVAVYPYYVHAG
jgi:hypothetical protein